MIGRLHFVCNVDATAFFTRDVFFRKYPEEKHHDLPAILAGDAQGRDGR